MRNVTVSTKPAAKVVNVSVKSDTEVLQAILRELQLIRWVLQGKTHMTNDQLEAALTGLLGCGPDEVFNK